MSHEKEGDNSSPATRDSRLATESPALDRRRFLTVLGASGAGAVALAGCSPLIERMRKPGRGCGAAPWRAITMNSTNSAKRSGFAQRGKASH